MPRALINGIELEYRDIGNRNDPAITLVMGFAAPMRLWPESLVACLVSKGLRVIMFDNRDAGLSQKVDAPKQPSVLLSIARYMLGRPTRSAYTLEDMADDVIGLADYLGIETFHLMGASMGGIISQVVSCRNEGRVLSLTSIMSTSGSGPVRPRAILKLAGLCAPRSSKEGYRRAWMHVVEFINEAPIRMEEEEIRRFVDYVLFCDYRPSAAKRQLLAALRSGDRTEQLRQIRTPTLVLHGTHDHLLPKEHAVSTARFIPNAKLEMLEGMGHNLPEKLGERLGCIVSDHVFDSTA